MLSSMLTSVLVGTPRAICGMVDVRGCEHQSQLVQIAPVIEVFEVSQPRRWDP